MKHISIIAVLCGLVLLGLGSCASTKEAPEQETSAALASEEESIEIENAVVADKIEKPSEGKALLNLWRPSSLGRSNPFFFIINGKLVAITKGSSLHQFELEPGPVVLMIRSQNWEILKGEFAAGKTYDLLTAISQGVTRGIVRWELVEANDTRITEETDIRFVSQTRNQLRRYLKRYEADAQALEKKLADGKAKFRTFSADAGH